MQRRLTQDLKDDLRNAEYVAAHCSGSSPVFLYYNDIEQVRVVEGHHWADLHPIARHVEMRPHRILSQVRQHILYVRRQVSQG